MDSRLSLLKAALGVSVAPGLLAWGQGGGGGRPLIASTGSRIRSIETSRRGPVSIVRVRTDRGQEGYGQISTYDAVGPEASRTRAESDRRQGPHPRCARLGRPCQPQVAGESAAPSQ